MATSAETLCRYKPDAFKTFTEAVMNLKFEVCVRECAWAERMHSCGRLLDAGLRAGDAYVCAGLPPLRLLMMLVEVDVGDVGPLPHCMVLIARSVPLAPRIAQEEPMYAAYIALFEPLLGASAPARPLQVENAVKVSGTWCMALIDWCGAVPGLVAGSRGWGGAACATRARCRAQLCPWCAHPLTPSPGPSICCCPACRWARSAGAASWKS